MICNDLDEILAHRKLASWFQPLVNLKEHRIIGYEALVRGPSDSPYHSPMKLFDAALRCDRQVDLELICREVHIRNFSRLELPGKLFLNVNPLTLQQPNHPTGFTLRHLEQYGLAPGDVVIELTEQVPIEDYNLLRATLGHYRSMGFAVAIDDLGAGYAGLRLWSELRPDYVKFDKHFIQGVNEDNSKRQFIRSMQEIALGLGCITIAEGIENQAEYRVMQSLGISIGQGYHFDRPKANPMRDLPVLQDLHHEAYCPLPGQRTENLSNLITEVPTIQPNTPLLDVDEIFSVNPDLWSIPVIDRSRPVGIIRRHEFLRLFASRYGRDLYSRHPIEKFMEPDPLIIDKHISLEKVSKVVTGSKQLQPGEYFIIVDQGLYVGVGTVMDLLRTITDLQVKNARYANPLTGLPGNVPINEILQTLIRNQHTFTTCYVDLDNFKPFNDFYDYNRGDQVLQMLAKLLADEAHPDRDFIGHIGGDDFMLIFQSEDWELRCQRILKRFSQQVTHFYDSRHRKDGGIYATNRSGEQVFYPLMTVSIGATRSSTAHHQSCHEVASRASEAKRMAKKTKGNSLFIDRRSHHLKVPSQHSTTA